MNFKRTALITFYDQPKDWPPDWPPKGQGSHVSAITGLIGEDLIIGLLRHYWGSNGGTSRILSYQCTPGTKKGKRLDAWLLHEQHNKESLFQIEIKNWSGHSLSGYNLPHDATEDDLKKFAAERWNHYFEGPNGLPSEIKKVLNPMSPPKGVNLSPQKLICFWAYIVNTGATPYCIKSLGAHEKVHVFSASAYLRGLSRCEGVAGLSESRKKRRAPVSTLGILGLGR